MGCWLNPGLPNLFNTSFSVRTLPKLKMGADGGPLLLFAGGL